MKRLTIQSKITRTKSDKSWQNIENNNIRALRTSTENRDHPNILCLHTRTLLVLNSQIIMCHRSALKRIKLTINHQRTTTISLDRSITELIKGDDFVLIGDKNANAVKLKQFEKVDI